MPPRREIVSINGVEYFIRGPVIAQPVSDFAANVRIGEPSYETRQGAGYAVIDDLSGGPGIMEGLMREDLSRYSLNWGVDTRFPRQATAPLASTIASNAPDAPDSAQSDTERTWARATNRVFQHFVELGLTVHAVFIYGHGIHHQEPKDYSLVWTTLDSGIDSIRDATPYSPVTGASAGTPLFIIVGKSGWRRSTNLGSVASPTELAAKEMYTCLAFGDKLLVQVASGAGLGTAAGDIVVSMDADTFVKDSGGTNLDIIWRLPPGHFLGPAAAPWGEMAPYFFTNNDLFVLNFWERAAYRVPVGLHGIKCATTWSDGLVLSDGYNIVQYVPGAPGNLRHIGLPKEQGFMSLAEWEVESLTAVDGDKLYALLRGKLGAVYVLQMWEYTGANWHPLGELSSHATIQYGLGMLVTDRRLGAAPSQHPQRVYWYAQSDLVANPGETARAYRVADPAGDTNPLVGTGAFSTSARYFETPWLDGGFRELKGAALQMWFGGYAATSQTVKIEYALDGDDSSFTTLGTFNGTQTHFNFGVKDTNGAYPGIEFRTIKFRVTLVATATVTPNALPLTFIHRKKPGLRMSYLINIDAARELKENDKEFATILTALATAWNTKTLIRFFYPVYKEDDTAVATADLEVDKRVDIVSMPSREEDIQDAMRKGAITVQVMEPCDW